LLWHAVHLTSNMRPIFGLMFLLVSVSVSCCSRSGKDEFELKHEAARAGLCSLTGALSLLRTGESRGSAFCEPNRAAIAYPCQAID
jgi:hypothetical protein